MTTRQPRVLTRKTFSYQCLKANFTSIASTNKNFTCSYNYPSRDGNGRGDRKTKACSSVYVCPWRLQHATYM